MIKIADVNMDNINIEIQSSSENAEQGVNTLIETLSTLNEKLKGVQGGVDKYVKKMQNLANITSKIKIHGFSKLKIPDLFKRDKSQEQNPLQNINFNNKNDDGGDSKSKKHKKNISEVNSKLRDLVEIAGLARQSINSTFKTLGKIITVRAGLKGLNMVFGDINSKVSGLSSGFKTLAKNLSKYSLALFGIRSAFYAVRNTSNEFLSSQDAVAKQLNANISYLKFAVGSMFAPIIEYLTNLMYKLLQVIQYIVYYFTRINIFAGKTAKSYAAMGNSASKTAKELNKQLQLFDELNNINLDRNSGSGGGAGADVPSFDLSQINEGLKPLFDDIDNLGKNLAEKINKALASIEWDKIIEKTTSATKKIANILNDFTSNLDFKLIGYTIAEGFNTVFANLNTFFETYNWSRLGEQLAIGLNSIINTLNWSELGKNLTNKFKALIDVLYQITKNLQWANLGTNIGIAINSGFNNIDFKKIADTINYTFLGVFDTILSSIRTINWNEIGTEISKFISGINWSEIINKVFQILIEGLQKTTILLEQILPTFVSVGVDIIIAIVEGIVKTIPQVINSIAQLIPKIVQAFVEKIPDLISTLANAIEKGIPNIIQATINLLLAIVDAIPKIIIAIVPEIPKIVIAIANGLTNSIDVLIDGAIKLFMAIVDAIPKIIIAIVPEIPKIVIAIANALIENIPTLIQGAIKLFTALILAIPKIIIALVPEIPKIVTSIVTTLIKNIPVLLEGAIKLFMALVMAIPTIIVELIKGFGEIIKSVQDNLLKPMGEKFQQIRDTMVNKIKEAKDNIATKITEIKDNIKEKFENVKNIVSEKFTNIRNTIKNRFDEAKNNVTNIAETMKSNMSNKFNEAKNNISNIAETIRNNLSNKFESAKNIVSEKFSNIKNSMANKLEEAKNTVGNLINRIKEKFNFQWSLPKLKMPHLSWSTQPVSGWIANVLSFLNLPTSLPKLNVSWYAQGGFPTEGELFIANEAGPEMVGSIGNKSAVANNDQITKAIADATYSAFVQALGENSGDSNQPLNIYIGNDKVYKGYTKHQSQMSNQYGVVV